MFEMLSFSPEEVSLSGFNPEFLFLSFSYFLIYTFLLGLFLGGVNIISSLKNLLGEYLECKLWSGIMDCLYEEGLGTILVLCELYSYIH